ncbi:MAG TPA: chemotaxis protein CheX [Planctomycetaceae bacterium]|nr:chemotaxis protein CheX [Planctomycetaceae bacterium]
MAHEKDDTHTLVVGDPTLLRALNAGVHESLSMCGIVARCVAISAVPAHDRGDITGLVGVHGQVSGYITLNLADRIALQAVGNLLEEDFRAVTEEVLDGAGELTNMLAGAIKRTLSGTPWGFTHMFVPSVIVGREYEIGYAKGFSYLSATFEHEAGQSILWRERLLQATVALIRI